MVKKPKDQAKTGEAAEQETEATTEQKALDGVVTEPEAQPEALPGTAGQIADALIAAMPEPQQEAIAAVREDAAPETTAAEPTQPEPTKRGRGRPPGSTTKRKSKVAQPEASANVASGPQATDGEAATRMAAATLTNLTLMCGVMIGGEDFRPAKNDMMGGLTDDQFLNAAYYDYCRAKNVVDIPPGVALCAALSVYVLPRLNRPSAQSRLKIVAVKIGDFFKRFRKPKNGAYVDPRNDGKRQDDTGGTTRPQI